MVDSPCVKDYDAFKIMGFTCCWLKEKKCMLGFFRDNIGSLAQTETWLTWDLVWVGSLDAKPTSSLMLIGLHIRKDQILC